MSDQEDRFKAFGKKIRDGKQAITVYADGKFDNSQTAITVLNDLAASMAKIDQEEEKGCATVYVAIKLAEGWKVINETTTYFDLLAVTSDSL